MSQPDFKILGIVNLLVYNLDSYNMYSPLCFNENRYETCTHPLYHEPDMHTNYAFHSLHRYR
jgi:hypothetical protein